MANIILFTTDAIGSDEIITAQTQAAKIRIREDANGISGGYLIRRTGIADPQTTLQEGAEMDFYPRGAQKFAIGEIVARISAISGSLNMVQIED